ncbi:LPXTG cell wall anchor domain-containing protein [Arthrobacter sp. TWP1-1]|uniref:S1 family peptidase n=1 Tax=Arthrobacter sp. TWP1-1 TaxID=2804568 RepID=UPI003CFB15B7
MRATKRAFFKRGGAACAAAAVLIGGTFAAGTATAAPSADSAPTSIATAVASAPATASATETALPDGLAEAVKQDLGKTVEEFNADAEVAAEAADVQAEVTATDPAAVVSVAGDTINVTTTDPEAAKAAAGTAKVNVTAAPTTPLVTKQHSDIDTVFADYAKHFGIANLQSIMQDASGNILIRTGDAVTDGPAPTSRSFMAAVKKTTDDFANDYANVVIEAAAGPVSALATDVTNGQGYAALSGASILACSIGWNGFNAAGKAAIISAGHCTDDGAATETALTNPATEPAVGGAGGGATALLGVFGASQFGGPNNSPVTGDVNGPTTGLGNIGTDVSVIDGINPDVNQLPQVTDWKTPAAPKDSGPVVTGVSTAILGADICKSGRTTGWSCAKVDEVGYFFVAGKNYPSDSNPGGDLKDIRGVSGFGSKALTANQGDSGGAIIAGSLAVGMVSAGIPGVISYGVDLKDALAHTAGYSVKIFLAAPTATTTAPVFRKGAITGIVPNTGTVPDVSDVPAGTTVTVTIDGVTTEAAVDGTGKWSVAAPNKLGTFPVTFQTKNGFNTSEITTASVEIIRETLAAPAITAPASNGKVAAPVTAVTGTGKAGATIELTGDVTGTVVVGADGKWSFTVAPGLAVGNYTVTAKQTLADWNDSTAVTNKFNVVPAAPAVASPTKGQEFTFNGGPAVISGSNIEGATVSVTINGKAYNAVVVDGSWSITLDAKLPTGDYTVLAVQTVDGVESLTTTSVFKVLAEPKPAPTTAPATQEPTTAPAKAPAGNDLANTGVSGSPLLLGVAGGLLMLGGAAFLLLRRRSAK